MDVSIIICTRDRAEHLRQTLESLNRLVVPVNVSAELIIVDNGSRDASAAIAAAFLMQNLVLRVVQEGRAGKSWAYNTGIAAAVGNILLFTDDDVRVPVNWIEVMCQPLWEGTADAVAGAVVLAPHLERTWMEPVHRYWLAATDPNVPEKSRLMVGANMAFRRAVLSKVPEFDLALGPGSLGFSDDTLFSRQLWTAGFKIIGLENEAVEHHFQGERLTRVSLRDAARKRGATKAYIAHHWEHRQIIMPAARMVHKWLQTALWHRRHPQLAAENEGLPTELMYNLEAYYFYRHYLSERRKPRLYEKHGLTKIAEHPPTKRSFHDTSRTHS